MLERASLVANCGLEDEMACTGLSRLGEAPGYFTTIVVR